MSFLKAFDTKLRQISLTKWAMPLWSFLSLALLCSTSVGIFVEWHWFILYPLFILAFVAYTLCLLTLTYLLSAVRGAKDLLASVANKEDINLGDMMASLEQVTKQNGLPSPAEMLAQLGLGGFSLPEPPKKETNED